MNVRAQILPVLAVLAVLWSGPVSAQSLAGPDPFPAARIRMGPLAMTPSLALTDVGTDSNVFNELENPKQDFTATLSPRLNTWFRAGRSRTAVTIASDLIYFQKYRSQRTIDGKVDALLQLPSSRLMPWVSGSVARGRQRYGYEVDVRVRRLTQSAGVGLTTRLASKTTLDLSAHRDTTTFDGDTFYYETRLAETLNREERSGGVEYRQALTVLTTFAARTEWSRSRFDQSPQRDTDSIRLDAGFELDDRALIAGSVHAGYRRVEGRGRGFPPFTGLTLLAQTSMTVFGRTQVTVDARRDMEYSFESLFPYYVITGATIAATPRLTDVWDVQFRAGSQHLSYRHLTDAGVGRLDRIALLGAGLGYRLGRSMRLGLNLDRQRRSSPVQGRDYKGFRLGTSVTYGR